MTQHYGNKRRTLTDILTQLRTELTTTKRLDSLTLDELTRRYSRLKPQVIEAELTNARKWATMTNEERLRVVVEGM